MARRHGEFDVAHAFTTNAGQRHFHAATIADDAAMLDAFILAAGAFPVLDGTENTFAEKTALFRLERAVVDGFWILDFTLAPRTDRIRGCERDADVVNLVDFVETEDFTGVFFGAGHTIFFQQIISVKLRPKWQQRWLGRYRHQHVRSDWNIRL